MLLISLDFYLFFERSRGVKFSKWNCKYSISGPAARSECLIQWRPGPGPGNLTDLTLTRSHRGRPHCTNICSVQLTFVRISVSISLFSSNLIYGLAASQLDSASWASDPICALPRHFPNPVQELSHLIQFTKPYDWLYLYQWWWPSHDFLVPEGWKKRFNSFIKIVYS